MMTKIWDLAFEVDGDSIEIEQDAGIGEVSRITLHRIHVAHIAGLLGLLKPDSPANLQTSCTLARENATLRRRMRTLQRKIEELDELLWSVPCYPPGKPTEDCRLSSALLELADEFIADFDDAVPEAEPSEPRDCSPREPATRSQPVTGGEQLSLEAA